MHHTGFLCFSPFFRLLMCHPRFNMPFFKISKERLGHLSEANSNFLWTFWKPKECLIRPTSAVEHILHRNLDLGAFRGKARRERVELTTLQLPLLKNIQVCKQPPRSIYTSSFFRHFSITPREESNTEACYSLNAPPLHSKCISRRPSARSPSWLVLSAPCWVP